MVDHLADAELRGYAHGHKKQYYDRHGNPTTKSTSFSRVDFDDSNSRYYADRNRYYADCPTASPPRREPDTRSESQSVSTSTEPIAITLERIIEEEPEPPVDIEVPEPPEMPVAVEMERWEVQFYRGWNLVSFRCCRRVLRR